MKMIMIYTACESKDEALQLARSLLSRKIAACVNILSPCTGVYWWKGKVEEGDEFPILIKTVENLVSEVVSFIQQNHKYEVPGIITWEAESLNPDYSQWMSDNLKAVG